MENTKQWTCDFTKAKKKILAKISLIRNEVKKCPSKWQRNWKKCFSYKLNGQPAEYVKYVVD